MSTDIPNAVWPSELSQVDGERTIPIIGLTGGVGSGKSEVARILESLGAGLVESDRLSHEELADHAVVRTLVAWWGESILGTEGGVDRAAVARIVFDDPVELTRLEHLLYPQIAQRRRALVVRYAADPEVRAVVFDSPKLCEAGLDKQCDVVVFVEAERSIRLARVAASRGWAETELSRREKLQDPLDSKKANADYVIVNHSAISALRPKVERVFSSVLASFS